MKRGREQGRDTSPNSFQRKDIAWLIGLSLLLVSGGSTASEATPAEVQTALNDPECVKTRVILDLGETELGRTVIQMSAEQCGPLELGIVENTTIFEIK